MPIPARIRGGGGSIFVICMFPTQGSSKTMACKRFWPPCLRGWDKIPAPAGPAEGGAGWRCDFVSLPEAGRPKSSQKWAPGAVYDCYKAPADPTYGAP